MAATNTGTDDINLAPENDDFEDANVDVHANDDDSGDATGQGNINVPAAPAAGGANGPTNFNLRVEQNKIPEFFGVWKTSELFEHKSWAPETVGK